MNGMLRASSHSNVASGIDAIRESRSAITSYLRGSLLSSVPSPNHAPSGIPAKVASLPCGDTLLIFSRPSITPIHWSTCSPRRITKAPAAIARSDIVAST